MDKVTVLGAAIAYYQKNEQDYISLTDMVKKFGDDTMIYSWMRNRNTLEFIGIWEELHNPSFNGNEFVTFKATFSPSKRWAGGCAECIPAMWKNTSAWWAPMRSWNLWNPFRPKVWCWSVRR